MVHQTFLLSDDRRSICCVDRRETLRRSRDVVNVVSVVVDVVEDVDVTLSSGSLNYFTFFIRPPSFDSKSNLFCGGIWDHRQTDRYFFFLSLISFGRLPLKKKAKIEISKNIYFHFLRNQPFLFFYLESKKENCLDLFLFQLVKQLNQGKD